MTEIPRPAKRWVPRPIWSVGSAVYWWWHNRGQDQLAGWLSPRRWESAAELRRLRNRHVGGRCFILGNGPSLRHTDWSRLRGETTFGMNRIYLLFAEMGFSTTYFVAVNSLVVEQCAQDIRSLAMPKFVAWRARRWVGGDPRVIFLDTDYRGRPLFSKEASSRIFEGSTVTYVALQLAFHMGFQEVVLLGVDHRFQSQGPPNSTVESEGEDPNHFSSTYFGRGFRWQLPDLQASEAAYGLAKAAYEADGRTILDATHGGALTVFPKVELAALTDSRGPIPG
ncbi:MAG: 6-hydroxymethylpterin diphosphokinase MptE-like protein [Anaerolineales bacterium]